MVTALYDRPHVPFLYRPTWWSVFWDHPAPCHSSVSTSDRNTLWWAILMADNMKTTHPQVTLYPVTTQQFTLFYTAIILIWGTW